MLKTNLGSPEPAGPRCWWAGVGAASLREGAAGSAAVSVLLPSHQRVLAVCDGRGVLLCSPSWCGSWLSRANPPAPRARAEWMPRGAGEQSPVPRCRVAGVWQTRGGGSGVSWGSPGCAEVPAPGMSFMLLFPCCHARHTRGAAVPGQHSGLQSQAVLGCSPLALGLTGCAPLQHFGGLIWPLKVPPVPCISSLSVVCPIPQA